MNPEIQRVREVFVAAVKLRPDRWEAFLEEACGDDEELRREVRELLEVHQQPDSFLDQPVAGRTAPNDGSLGSDGEFNAAPSEIPGTNIGPYKLLQQIGEGGMGVVYLAEQSEPVKRCVALKIIKPGMDSQQVIARFEAERQALAMMDHPNIARVVDAGTTESARPYFVMELVRGVPITQYCDQHHLTPKERLQLFVPVCHAVEHAHQKGVIHRDIKPSNVLVAEYDEVPMPKIIDFGVAKAIQQRLAERTMFTQFGQVVGTIDYMSPEQASLNELDIDTRSDVYSLGVLLYELLTGETPFDGQRLRKAAFDELLRIIREEEPPKPSARLSASLLLTAIAANRHTEPRRLSTLVRGELDWIVMKALEKDRSRRYESANALAADVLHQLADEPVVACPPSAVYRFKKFARRNRGLLLTATTTLVVLLAATIVSTSQAVRAKKAERVAADRLVAEEHAVLEKSRSLWRSYVNEAAALRRTHRTGHRVESLNRLRAAAQMLPALQLPEESVLELRNEWIACSALPLDLRYEKQVVTGGEVVVIDAAMHYCLCRDAQRAVHLHYFGDGRPVTWLAGQEDFAFCEWGNIFSLNERFLAGRSRADYYRVFDLDEHCAVRDIPMAPGLYAVAFAPDSAAIAFSGPDKHIHIQDLTTGTELSELPAGPPLPDKPPPNVEPRLLEKLSLPRRLWFSPNGRLLAVAFYWSCDLHVRDISSGETIPLRHPSQVRLASWSFDGRLLAVSCDDFNIYVWDSNSWEQQTVLRGHQWKGIDAIFWPRSYRLFSGSWDGTRRLWDAGLGLELLRMPGIGWVSGVSVDESYLLCPAPQGAMRWQIDTSHTFDVLPISAPSDAQRNSVTFNPGGQLLGCASDLGVHLWDLTGHSESAMLPVDMCHDAIFDPLDGSLIVSADKGLHRWPLQKGPAGHSVLSGSSESLTTEPSLPTGRICLSPDGRFLAAARTDDILWCDLQTHQTKVSSFAPDLTCSVSLSSNGRWVGTGAGNGTGFLLWDTQSDLGATTNLWPVSQRFWSVFDDTGQWLQVSTTDACRVYRAGSWDIAHQWVENVGASSKRAQFGPAAFTADGSLLAVVSDLGSVRLTSTVTWTELATLEPFEQRTITALTFSPHGDLLAVATLNDGVQLWDLRQIRRELRTLSLDWQDSSPAAIPRGVDPPSRVRDGAAESLSTSRPNSTAHAEKRNLATVLKKAP